MYFAPVPARENRVTSQFLILLKNPRARVSGWLDDPWPLFFRPAGLGGGLHARGDGLGKAFHLKGSAVEQGPVDLFAGFETDGCGERQRHIDIQPGVAPFRADRLHGDGI